MSNSPKLKNISALAPGTAVRPKGKQRVQQILRTATEVLAFEGYSAFTMRNVASKAGISLRNLQYYFKSKSDLFQAVVDGMQETELASAVKAIQQPCLSDMDRFKHFIDYSIRDNQRPLIRGFQFELWALATRDPFAAKCRDRMTKVYCEFILGLVKPLTPNLSAEEQQQKAAIILALLQGIPLLVGQGVATGFPVGNLQGRVKDHVLELLGISEPH